METFGTFKVSAPPMHTVHGTRPEPDARIRPAIVTTSDAPATAVWSDGSNAVIDIAPPAPPRADRLASTAPPAEASMTDPAARLTVPEVSMLIAPPFTQA